MNKSELANIDKFKGVIIEPNGIAHSFGHCLMIPNEHSITGELTTMFLMMIVKTIIHN